MIQNVNENYAMMLLGGVLFAFAMTFVYAFRKVALEKYHTPELHLDDYRKATAKVLEELTDNSNSDLYDKICIVWQDTTGTEFRNWIYPEENNGFIEIWYLRKNPEEFFTDEEFQQKLSDSQYNGTYVHSLTFRAGIAFLMILTLLVSVCVFEFGLIRLLKNS